MLIVKYKGYIERERGIVDKMFVLEKETFLEKFDYMLFYSLNVELQFQRLKRHPGSLRRSASYILVDNKKQRVYCSTRNNSRYFLLSTVTYKQNHRYVCRETRILWCLRYCLWSLFLSFCLDSIDNGSMFVNQTFQNLISSSFSILSAILFSLSIYPLYLIRISTDSSISFLMIFLRRKCSRCVIILIRQ